MTSTATATTAGNSNNNNNDSSACSATDDDTEESSKPINISKNEMNRLEDCFKDPKFRDLLSDYCAEIANPKTKLAYEEYLKDLESNGLQPNNRKLIKPKSSFCIKLKMVDENDKKNKNNGRNRKSTKKGSAPKSKGKKQKQKTNGSKTGKVIKKTFFINVCSMNNNKCEKGIKIIEDAKLVHTNGFDHPRYTTGDKRAGICWQIPYILGLKRVEKDINATQQYSEVIDIAFHDNTCIKCKIDKKFKSVVIQTAIEAVQKFTKYQFYPKYKLLKAIASKGEPALMSVVIPEATTTAGAESAETENSASATHSAPNENDNHGSATATAAHPPIGNNTPTHKSSPVQTAQSKKANTKTKAKAKAKVKAKVKPRATSTLLKARQKVNNTNTDNNNAAKKRPDSNSNSAKPLVSMVDEMINNQKNNNKIRRKNVRPEHRMVESANCQSIQECWSDKHLMIDPNVIFHRPRQLIVYIEMPRLFDTRNIDCQIISTAAGIDLHNNNNNNNDNNTQTTTTTTTTTTTRQELQCTAIINASVMYSLTIKLSYPVVKPSLTAKWFSDKCQLKCMMNVQRFNAREIQALKAKYANIYHKPIVADKNSNPSTNDQDAGAIPMPIQIENINANANQNGSGKLNGNGNGNGNGNKSQKSAVSDENVVPKKQSDADCVAGECIADKANAQTFDDDDDQKSENASISVSVSGTTESLSQKVSRAQPLLRSAKKVMKDIEYEYREKLTKFAVIFRMENIMKHSLQIHFEINSVSIAFETHEYCYQKVIRCCRNIDVDQCSYDLNARNLCILLAKHRTALKMWNRLEIAKNELDVNAEHKQSDERIHHDRTDRKPKPDHNTLGNNFNDDQSQTIQQLLNNDPEMFIID